MLKNVRSFSVLGECRMLPCWAFGAGTALALPPCVVWQLELHPGTTYLDHVAATSALLCGVAFLLIAPSPRTDPDGSLPDEHIDVFRYAIRSGVLPIASLFSDWTRPLEQLRNVLAVVLRILPVITGAAVVMDLYGILLDPQGHVFFLVS